MIDVAATIKSKFSTLREWSGFSLYAKLNLKIPTKEGMIKSFLLNRMQLRLISIIIACLATGRPIRIFLVKARQLGSTTLFSAILYWLVSLNRNKYALAVAHDLPAAHNICERFKNYYFRSHRLLRPRFKRMNRDLIHFATPQKDMRSNADGDVDMGLDSLIVVNTAETEIRSYTFQYALLTEICHWPMLGIDVKLKMVALNQAIPETPESIIFIESTARGENYTKEFWDKGMSLDQFLGTAPLDPEKEYNGYVQVFVSWCADDQYRKDIKFNLSTNQYEYFDLMELPNSRYGNEFQERQNILAELKNWYPETENGKEIDKSNYPNWNKFNSYKSWLFHETMCRIYWRRHIIDTKCEGDKFLFKQEYPTTVEDAWGTTSGSIFKEACLLEMRDRIIKNKITPHKFRYHHISDETNFTNWQNKFMPTKHGHLRLFQTPREGAKYVCGADAAQGIQGGDPSACVILKLPHLEEVASFSDIIEAAEFAGFLNYLCRYYNNALLGVERNDKGGFAALEFLTKIYYYPNLYYYVDPFKLKLEQEVRYGWHNSDPTRQILIRDGKTAISNMDTIINSEEIISECFTFIENKKTGKIAAAPGKHDDLVISWLIALQMARQVHIKPIAPTPTRPPKYSVKWFENTLADKQFTNKKEYAFRRN